MVMMLVMDDLLLNHYLWIQALHIIAVICWMAVLLYLPRLFIYHCDAPVGSDQSETFKVMEKRLIRYIGGPSMIAVWLFGVLMLIANPDLMSQGWMHVKLTCVIAMTGAHHVFLKYMKKFAADANIKSAKFYRVANEIPTILMVVIVLMAVAKPF